MYRLPVGPVVGTCHLTHDSGSDKDDSKEPDIPPFDLPWLCFNLGNPFVTEIRNDASNDDEQGKIKGDLKNR